MRTAGEWKDRRKWINFNAFLETRTWTARSGTSQLSLTPWNKRKPFWRLISTIPRASSKELSLWNKKLENSMNSKLENPNKRKGSSDLLLPSKRAQTTLGSSWCSKNWIMIKFRPARWRFSFCTDRCVLQSGSDAIFTAIKSWLLEVIRRLSSRASSYESTKFKSQEFFKLISSSQTRWHRRRLRGNNLCKQVRCSSGGLMLGK